MSRNMYKLLRVVVSLLGLLIVILFITPKIILAIEESDQHNITGNYSDKTENINTETAEFFPIIVYGGEPEGVSAAISSARKGMKTLLIMNRDKPGGLMTYGGLNFLDINNGPDGDNLNKGFFEEWHQKVGGKVSFSIEKATDVFEKLIDSEENLQVYRNNALLSVNKQANSITGIIVDTEDGIKELNARYFIDASQDADLAVEAGAHYFEGGADIGLPDRHMAVTIVLHLGGIDWSELAKDARSNKFGPSYISKDNAWGFVEIGQMYRPVNKNTKMRGLNIVIEDKGDKAEVYINALLVFNVDPTDKDSLKQAYQRGKKEAKFVVDFLRKNLGGFENAKILPFPEELYVRESRHIVSRYQLKVEDLFNNRYFSDTIALASYPLDYQASSPKYNGFVLFNPDLYGIPLRSLLPKGIDNIFVVGRSSGYSSLAAASARVIPTGMAAAEAAGIVSAYCLSNNMTISEFINNKISTQKIQYELGIERTVKKYKDYIGSNLVFDSDNLELQKDNDNIFKKLYEFIVGSGNDQKAAVNPGSLKNELKNHVEYLLSWGLLVGGYNNDFKLDKEISEREFAHIIVKGLKQQQAPILYEWVPGGLETMSSNRSLSRDQAAMLLMVAISKRVSEIAEDKYFEKASEYNLIPTIIKNNIKKDRVLTRAEAYILISSFLQKYPIKDTVNYYRGGE